jgi:hypothetical protein
MPGLKDQTTIPPDLSLVTGVIYPTSRYRQNRKHWGLSRFASRLMVPIGYDLARRENAKAELHCERRNNFAKLRAIIKNC